MEGNKVTTASLLIIVIFIAGVVLRLAKPVLFPFFLAILLSFMLYPALDFMTRLKIPKAVAIIFILILTFFVFYLLGTVIYSSSKAFAAEFPNYGRKITSILVSIQEKLKQTSLDREPIDWVGQLDLGRLGSLLFASLGPFFSFISNLFLILLFLVFILAGRGHSKDKIQNSFSSQQTQQIIDVIQNIDSQVQKYLAIKTVVSFVTGVLATVVLMLFGVNFAVFFGFLTFLLNYIPNIGSIIATAFPLVIAVLQFDTLWPAFWILLILGTIQMALGNFIEPRLMGEGLGLSPLVVLFFLFFWGWLWGIPGMILSVPIAAVIKIICQNIPALRFVAVMMSKG